MSQCQEPVQAPLSTCGTGNTLTSNVTINNGDTYFSSGGSFSNITMNGGILEFCGPVTITDLNFNSGAMIINSIASVIFNGNFNVGGGPIQYYNFGSSTFNQANFSVQGNSNFIYNESGATITLNGAIVIFNNGVLINNGTINGQDVTVNSGSICLGPNSVISMNNIRNDAVNPISVPSGSACATYKSTFEGNNPITATSALNVCQQPGATNPATAAIGAATVTANCSSCATLIPIDLVSFDGNILNGRATLYWKTSSEDRVRGFIVEISSDGKRYNSLAEVAAKNRGAEYQFSTTISGNTFFRLKMVDLDGQFKYSPVLVLKTDFHTNQILLFSNPVMGNTAQLQVYVSREQSGKLILMDVWGRVVQTRPVSLNAGINTIRLDLTLIKPGIYHLSYAGPDQIRSLQMVRL
ncbi:MAG: hypothetical protein C5B52_18395 [Bacteroidetes bacterium]|nr:MAG: hypothetical protein C5B52_18395 [Bacteroidota bacterium]